MKSRIVFILLLLVALFVLVGRSNHFVQDYVLNIVSPIKQYYKNMTRSVKDRGDSYIFQKETIQKLTKENKTLRKFLLDQTNYIQQVSSLYKKIPSLEKLPHKSIEVVNTVSYVRLNSFNEILLEKPKDLKLQQDKVYGIIQNNVVGGTAILRGDHLYGYLSSNPKCKFGVFVGKSRSPGIAEGVDKDTMAVKFIPKWSKIEVGDKVETSGLDGIFFSNIPVGEVKEIKIENSYKTAYIKTFSDTMHPDYFFLVTDARPYLASQYDSSSTNLDNNVSIGIAKQAQTDKNISSIPETIQTADNTVNPEEFTIPEEEPKPVTKKKVKAPKSPFVFLHNKNKKEKKKAKAKKKKRKKPIRTNRVTAPTPRTQSVHTIEQNTPPPTQPQPQKKRKSAMDILNGR